MGKIIKKSLISIDDYKASKLPMILCNCKPLDEHAIIEAGYNYFSLNYPLASALTNLPDVTRVNNVQETVFSLLPKNTPTYLTDYEMLFDPRYNLDVIKLFIEIARYNKLIIKWCGKVQNESTLVYSEPGYQDYTKYNINDYDIIIII